MNPSNYASLEMCRKLHEAGIEIETEKQWWRVGEHEPSIPWIIIEKDPFGFGELIPAPNLSEVWRELPEDNSEVEILIEDWLIASRRLYKGCNIHPSLFIQICRDVNQLCELLIWLAQQAKDEPMAPDCMWSPGDR